MTVPEADDDDWSAGISADLRKMFAAGASNEMIDLYIEARRSVDAHRADRVPCTTPEISSHQPMVMGPPPDPAIALDRLRVAALRPVVNRLDAETLRTYIEIIFYISDQFVRSEQNHHFWSNASFIERMAMALMGVALEHIQSERPSASRRGSSH